MKLFLIGDGIRECVRCSLGFLGLAARWSQNPCKSSFAQQIVWVNIEYVCNALSIDRQVARRWRKRFLEGGMEALKDRPKTGRPEKINEKVWRKVTTLIVQPPGKFSIEQNRWTSRLLRDYLREKYSWEVSRSSINRFLKKMALKPHLIKYWLNPNDPDFDEKALRQRGNG